MGCDSLGLAQASVILFVSLAESQCLVQLAGVA